MLLHRTALLLLTSLAAGIVLIKIHKPHSCIDSRTCHSRVLPKLMLLATMKDTAVIVIIHRQLYSFTCMLDAPVWPSHREEPATESTCMDTSALSLTHTCSWSYRDCSTTQACSQQTSLMYKWCGKQQNMPNTMTNPGEH